jgi:multicomponent Na+:H+ antiporter subunit D
VLFFLGSMALAGLPPMNGFISKLMVFQTGIAAQQWFWLGVIGVASMLTLVYTMRAFQRVWWQPAAEGVKAKPGGDRLWAPAALIATCLLLGIWSEPLVRVAQSAAQWSTTPSSYIAAVSPAKAGAR